VPAAAEFPDFHGAVAGGTREQLAVGAVREGGDAVAVSQPGVAENARDVFGEVRGQRGQQPTGFPIEPARLVDLTGIEQRVGLFASLVGPLEQLWRELPCRAGIDRLLTLASELAAQRFGVLGGCDGGQDTR